VTMVTCRSCTSRRFPACVPECRHLTDVNKAAALMCPDNVPPRELLTISMSYSIGQVWPIEGWAGTEWDGARWETVPIPPELSREISALEERVSNAMWCRSSPSDSYAAITCSIRRSMPLGALRRRLWEAEAVLSLVSDIRDVGENEEKIQYLGFCLYSSSAVRSINVHPYLDALLIGVK